MGVRSVAIKGRLMRHYHIGALDGTVLVFGAPEARYGLLEDGAFSVRLLTYDIAGAGAVAVADMQTAGLTTGHHTALQPGVWPSEDVLSQDLRVSGLANG